MSRNSRCTIGLAIVWGLFALNFGWAIFVGNAFFGGLSQIDKSGWDMQLIYGITKIFLSGLGALIFFGVAAGLIKAEGWLCRWKAGKA